MDLGTRDIILGLAVLASLPLSVIRPFFGLLVFSWLAYMRPADMTWHVGEFHPSLWVGLATVIGVAINPAERFFVLEKRTVLLGLFVAAVAASALAAIDPQVALSPSGNVLILAKAVFIAILTTGLVNSADRARWLLLVIAGSLGLLALKTFAQGLTSPGIVYHGPGGMIADNNDYGLALVMTLPLLVFLWRGERGPFLKVVLALMSVACVAGVLLTRSRGGVVALGVLWLATMILMRKDWRVLVAGPVALAGVLLLVPAELFERFRALMGGGALDESAALRLVAWEKAWNMFQVHPLMGVGPANFTQQWGNYAPYADFDPITPHNTYLHVLAESGAVSLALFAAVFVVTLVCLARLRARATEPWRRHYATAVLLSLVAFAAGAVFLSRVSFDLFYHLIGLSVALGVASTEGQFDWFGMRRAGRSLRPAAEAELPPVGAPYGRQHRESAEGAL